MENPLLFLLFFIGTAFALKAFESSREKAIRKIVREELEAMFQPKASAP